MLQSLGIEDESDIGPNDEFDGSDKERQKRWDTVQLFDTLNDYFLSCTTLIVDLLPLRDADLQAMRCLPSILSAISLAALVSRPCVCGASPRLPRSLPDSRLPRPSSR